MRINMGCIQLLIIVFVLYTFSQILGCPRDFKNIFRRRISKFGTNGNFPIGRSDEEIQDPLIPYYYGINITIGRKINPKISGVMTIKFECKKAINQIDLTGRDMEVNEADIRFGLDDGQNKMKTIKSLSVLPESNLIEINLKDEMEVGKNYTVTLYYEISNSKVNSFYFTYVDSDQLGNKEERYYVLMPNEIQQPADAYPCFQKRKFASLYDICITRPKEMNSLTNMELKDTTTLEDEDSMQDCYKTSPPMNIVSATCIMHKMEVLTDSTPRGLKIGVYSPMDKENLRSKGLEILTKSIDLLEVYFNSLLPLDKIDNFPAALKSAAALSSLGIHIFDNDELLINEENKLDKLKFKFDTFAHELTHQWFGNIVYADDLENGWITEAVADLMGSYIINIIKPDFKMVENLFLEKYKVAEDEDSTKLSHPLNVRQPYPNNDRQYVDLNIGYLKGSSILRMVNDTMGAINFQKAFQDFLRKFNFKSYTTHDFWSVLSEHIQGSSFETNNINFIDFADTWAEQMGYPVLTIERNYKDNITIRLSQKRFLDYLGTEDIPNEEYSNKGFIWKIPVRLRSRTQSRMLWLEDKSRAYTDVKLSPSDWLLANEEHVGFYRVNYDKQNWNLIRDQLLRSPDAISIIGRAGLMDDAFKLSEFCFLDITVPLDITLYLQRENEYTPLKIAIDNFSKIYKRYIYNDKMAKQSMAKCVTSLLKHVYDRFTWDDLNSDSPVLTLRASVFGIMCLMDYDDCVKKAKINLPRYLDGTASDDSLKDIALCTVMRNDTSSWETIFEKYNNYKQYGAFFFLNGLSCTEVPENIERYLDYTLSDNVEKYLKGDFLKAIMINPFATDISWMKVKDLIPGLFSGEQDDGIIDNLQDMVQNVNSLDIAPVNSFNSFNKEKYNNEFNRKKALNVISGNQHWLDCNKKAVLDWLRKGKCSSNILNMNNVVIRPRSNSILNILNILPFF